MEVACPQCGNPNLDVDEANSVVYCKKCGFAVRVDPQSGQVTPLTEGGAPGGAEMPQAYAGRRILGTDPLTFFLAATALLLFSTMMAWLPSWSWFIMLESAVLIYWWYNR
jgi:DNA-directed RNA polymerase subunit RPC12/RpoP